MYFAFDKIMNASVLITETIVLSDISKKDYR